MSGENWRAPAKGSTFHLLIEGRAACGFTPKYRSYLANFMSTSWRVVEPKPTSRKCADCQALSTGEKGGGA